VAINIRKLKHWAYEQQVGRSLISWKDWFFTCRQGKGKSLMATLRST